MQTSVYKEIPDDSIEGSKIKDDTDVNYFGNIVLGDFRLRENGNGTTRAQLIGNSSGSYLDLKEGPSEVIGVHLSSYSSNYLLETLIIGQSTPVTGATTQKLQVNGGIYCSGTGTFNSLIIGTKTPSASQWGFLADANYAFGKYQMNQDVRTSDSVTFSSLTVGTKTPSASQWGFLADADYAFGKYQMDQDVRKNDDVSFKSLVITSGDVTAQDFNPLPTGDSFVTHINKVNAHNLTFNVNESNPFAGRTSADVGNWNHVSSSIKYKQFGNQDNALFICRIVISATTTSTPNQLIADLSLFFNPATANVDWHGLVMVAGSVTIPCWGSVDSNGDLIIQKLDGTPFSAETLIVYANIQGPTNLI